MIRAVVDTNVIVSAILAPRSVPGQLIAAWRNEALSLILTETLLAELTDVLLRPRIMKLTGLDSEKVSELVARIRRDSEFIEGIIPVEPVVIADPDDDQVIAAASAAQADVIISGDKHLLSLGEHRGIPIISPRQMLDELEESAGS